MESRTPLRTCVGCRRKDGQPYFLRISRLPNGEINLTSGGPRTGRGAYVCPNQACLELALKGDRLAKALRGPVSAEDKDALRGLLATPEHYAN